MEELANLDASALDYIFNNFYDKEEYGDFQVANKNFREIDPDDFLLENENKNTKRKTESDMKLFMSFLMAKNEARLPEYIPPDELNHLLCTFILGITKNDGSEYEPTTIKGFISSIDRHLKSKSSHVSIFKDVEFSKTRAVLTKKHQQLKSLGLGNKPKTAEVLDDATLDKMYENGTLGDGNPRATVKQKAFGNDEDTRNDPVHLYKMYRDKRPESMCSDESPFFLTPGGGTQKSWYRKAPMGINKLYNIMNDMKSDANITNSRITPYSSRKRLIQKLQDKGVPAHQIVQISGHKNINSINNYSKINNDQSKNISDILSNKIRNTHSDLQVRSSTPKSASMTMSDCVRAGDNNGKPPQGLFAYSHFNGNVTFNFNSSISESLSQVSAVTLNRNTSSASGSAVVDPCSPIIRSYKRIRMLPDSDTDSN